MPAGHPMYGKGYHAGYDDGFGQGSLVGTAVGLGVGGLVLAGKWAYPKVRDAVAEWNLKRREKDAPTADDDTEPGPSPAIG